MISVVDSFVGHVERVDTLEAKNEIASKQHCITVNLRYLVILLCNETITPKPQNEGTDLEIVEALFHAVYWDIFVQLILSEKLDVKVDGFLVGRHLRVEGPDLQEDFGGTRIESMVIPAKKRRKMAQKSHHSKFCRAS